MNELKLEDIELEGVSNEEFVNLFRGMVREELTKLLNGEFSHIKPKQRKQIDTKQKAQVEEIREYWNEIASIPNTKLFHNTKLNILEALDKYGRKKVWEAIDIIWASPLMKGNNVYKKHLQSLDWCMKPESIDKIFRGLYSKDKGGFQNDDFKPEEEEWG